MPSQCRHKNRADKRKCPYGTLNVVARTWPVRIKVTIPSNGTCTPESMSAPTSYQTNPHTHTQMLLRLIAPRTFIWHCYTTSLSTNPFEDSPPQRLQVIQALIIQRMLAEKPWKLYTVEIINLHNERYAWHHDWSADKLLARCCVSCTG